MPHIHNEPNQHDMTVSAYIVRQEAGEWKCLVHMHKKIDKLMQIGGHIELDETPWQSMAHELGDETGYQLPELTLLQPFDTVPSIGDAIVHPVPFLVNTHNVGNDHYHSDLCYAFIANDVPSGARADGESADLRWYSLDELSTLARKGEALEDVANIYETLLQYLSKMSKIDPSLFSLTKPIAGVTYKRGAPGTV